MRALSLLVATLVATGLTAIPPAHAAFEYTITPSLVEDIAVTSDTHEDDLASPDGETLAVGTLPGGADSRAYLRFDPSMLSGGEVVSATLRLAVASAPECGPSAQGVQVQRVDFPWTGDFLHWFNAPASDGIQVSALDCAEPPEYVEWPVTDLVTAWASGTLNHGFVLQAPNELLADDGYWTFASAENSGFAAPRLTVTMTTGTVVVPRKVPVAPVHVSPGGGVTIASLTPVMSAAQVQIAHNPGVPEQGTGLIWSGAASPLPDGVLQQGWKIQWRGRSGPSAAWTQWEYGVVWESLPQVFGFRTTPSASDGAPELRALVYQDYGFSMNATFEVAHDEDVPEQGTGAIWTGDDERDIVPATPARVTVPGAVLEDGWKIQWRVRARTANGLLVGEWSEWQKATVDLQGAR